MILHILPKINYNNIQQRMIILGDEIDYIKHLEQEVKTKKIKGAVKWRKKKI